MGETGCAECDARTDFFLDLRGTIERSEIEYAQIEDTKITESELISLTYKWEAGVLTIIEHNFLTAHQRKHFLIGLRAICDEKSDGSVVAAVFDFSTGIRLVQSKNQTQEQFQQTGEATAFGLVEYTRGNKIEGKKTDRQSQSSADDSKNWNPLAFELDRTSNLMLSSASAHDCYTDLWVQNLKRRRPNTQRIDLWSDNGSGFHSSPFMQMIESIGLAHGVSLTINFFAPGEGKNDCDRYV